MGIEVKKMIREDRDFFLEKCKDFYDSPIVDHKIDESYFLRTFDELITRDTYLLGYIIYWNNTKIGYALLSKMFSTEVADLIFWIEELYVDEEYRSLGVGKHFFEWLEENHPAIRYRLDVTESNKGAIKLYKKLGYTSLDYLQFCKDLDEEMDI